MDSNAIASESKDGGGLQLKNEAKGRSISYLAPLMPLTVDDLLHIAGLKFENPLSQALYLTEGILAQARVRFDRWRLATTLSSGLQVWEREVKFSPSVMMMR